jgi:hypothetical protein
MALQKKAAITSYIMRAILFFTRSFQDTSQPQIVLLLTGMLMIAAYFFRQQSTAGF